MQNRTQLIMAMIIAALIVALMISVATCNKNGNRADQLHTAMLADQDSTRHFTNKQGEQVATKEVVDVSGKDADLFLNRDSIASHVNAKAKDVQEYTKVVSQGNADVKPATPPQIVYRDTSYGLTKAVRYMTQKFESPYYKADVRIGDSSYLHLKTFDTVSHVKIQTHTGGIFNRRYFTQLNIINSNPDLVVTGIKSYQISEDDRPKKFELDGRAGYMFGKSLTSPVAYAGAGVTVVYKRVSVGASYNYDLGNAKPGFVDVKAKLILIKL